MAYIGFYKLMEAVLDTGIITKDQITDELVLLNNEKKLEISRIMRERSDSLAKAVIYLYTTDLIYRNFNEIFKKDEIHKVIASAAICLKEIMQEKNNHYEKLLVYRGIKSKDLAIYKKSLQNSTPLFFPGFLSTSKAKCVAKQFAGNGIVLKIKLDKNQAYPHVLLQDGMSNFDYEKEIIIMSHLPVYVQSINEDKMIVHLIQCPYVKVQVNFCISIEDFYIGEFLTVKDVKRKIKSKVGAPIKVQQLKYRGNILSNELIIKGVIGLQSVDEESKNLDVDLHIEDFCHFRYSDGYIQVVSDSKFPNLLMTKMNYQSGKKARANLSKEIKIRELKNQFFPQENNIEFLYHNTIINEDAQIASFNRIDIAFFVNSLRYPSFQLKIKFSFRIIYLEVKLLDLIENIKRQLSDKERIPYDEIILYLNCEILEDKQMLSYYNIQPESRLILKNLSDERKRAEENKRYAEKLMDNKVMEADSANEKMDRRCMSDQPPTIVRLPEIIQVPIGINAPMIPKLQMSLPISNNVHILVEVLNEYLLFIDCEIKDSIQAIKEIIKGKTGIPSGLQKLIICGHICSDDHPLYLYCQERNYKCTIQLSFTNSDCYNIKAVDLLQNFNCNISDSIEYVKTRICESLSITAPISIFYNQNPLKDHRKLYYYKNLLNETTNLEINLRDLQIFIKTINGNTIALQITGESYYIERIKATIQAEERIFSGQQNIILAGFELKDGYTVSDYHIQNGSTLYQTLRKSDMKSEPTQVTHGKKIIPKNFIDKKWEDKSFKLLDLKRKDWKRKSDMKSEPTQATHGKKIIPENFIDPIWEDKSFKLLEFRKFKDWKRKSDMKSEPTQVTHGNKIIPKNFFDPIWEDKSFILPDLWQCKGCKRKSTSVVAHDSDNLNKCVFCRKAKGINCYLLSEYKTEHNIKNMTLINNTSLLISLQGSFNQIIENINDSLVVTKSLEKLPVSDFIYKEKSISAAFISKNQQTVAFISRIKDTTDCEISYSTLYLQSLYQSDSIHKIEKLPVIDYDLVILAGSLLVYVINKLELVVHPVLDPFCFPFTLYGHKKSITCIESNSDGSLLFSADKIIKVWSLETRSLKFEMKGHEAIINCMRIDNMNRFLVSGGLDRNIIVWNINERLIHRKISAHTLEIRAVAFFDCGNFILSGAHDAFIKMWKFRTGEPITQNRGNSWVRFIEASSDSKYIYVGLNNNTIKCYGVTGLR